MILFIRKTLRRQQNQQLNRQHRTRHLEVRSQQRTRSILSPLQSQARAKSMIQSMHNHSLLHPPQVLKPLGLERDPSRQPQTQSTHSRLKQPRDSNNSTLKSLRRLNPSLKPTQNGPESRESHHQMLRHLMNLPPTTPTSWSTSTHSNR